MNLTIYVATRILDPFLCHRNIIFELAIAALGDVIMSRRLLALSLSSFTDIIGMLKFVADSQSDEAAQVMARSMGTILMERYKREHPDSTAEG
eukprot:gnl/Chilomastix_caulleri/8653.p1 GENE.gnl/Chilomastix_caulleri/8653~~gnl/Chilomastix_caulleri/8653.p1  ORF type:complete len:93 (+),score=9.51 gnl/Chilomastix_caulleri/8653:141-419(+)